LAAAGYVAPQPRTRIPAPGTRPWPPFPPASTSWAKPATPPNTIKGRQLDGLHSLRRPRHSGALVSEQYILDLEREAFLSLCGERKTQERIAFTLKPASPAQLVLTATQAVVYVL